MTLTKGSFTYSNGEEYRGEWKEGEMWQEGTVPPVPGDRQTPHPCPAPPWGGSGLFAALPISAVTQVAGTASAS